MASDGGLKESSAGLRTRLSYTKGTSITTAPSPSRDLTSQYDLCRLKYMWLRKKGSRFFGFASVCFNYYWDARLTGQMSEALNLHTAEDGTTFLFIFTYSVLITRWINISLTLERSLRPGMSPTPWITTWSSSSWLPAWPPSSWSSSSRPSASSN